MRNQGQWKITHHLWISLLFVGLEVTLSGCGKSQQSKSPSEEFDLEAYIEESCQYSAEEGGAVSLETSAHPIVKGYFEKEYNQDWLRAVGHSSMRETLAYIEKTGARVYRANAISERSCKPFSFAAVLPADMSKEWASTERIVADQSLQTGSKGFIAGLYLPRSENSVDLPSLKDQSAVIVRADGSRWTLVHEFMHHNFRVQSIASGNRINEIGKESQSLADKLNEGLTDKNLSDLEKVKRLTPVFLQFAEISDLFIVEYPLEEIAIEATLQDQVDSGELTFVPTKSYTNANWYIEHSMATIEGLYRSMDDVYYYLRERAAKNQLQSEYDALSRHLELKAKRVEQLKVMMKKRLVSRHESLITGFQNLAEAKATPVAGNAPCAEAAAAYRTIEELSVRISRIRAGL